MLMACPFFLHPLPLFISALRSSLYYICRTNDVVFGILHLLLVHSIALLNLIAAFYVAFESRLEPPPIP